MSTVVATDVSKHRVIFDRQLQPGTYRIVDVPGEAAGFPPFWRYLSNVGKRSTLCSVYGNTFLDEFEGTQVVGWGSYDPFSAKLPGPRTDPPELLDRLKVAVPNRRSGFLPVLPYRDREFRLFKRETIEQVGLQTRGLELLMRETEWDFFFGAYQHAHEAGHLLWHRTDDLIDVYRAIDRDIGRIVAALPSDANLLFVTPYGMGPMKRARESMDVFLEQGGWLARRQTIGRTKVAAKQAARSAYRLLPYELRLAIGRFRPPTFAVDDPLAGIDWERTRAFQLPHDEVSLIRLNLKGREPAGTVAPGSEYDSLIEELSDAIGQIADAETGEPLVEGVIRFDELLGEPVRHSFPDLVVEWRDGASQRIRSRVGVVESTKRDPRSGAHPTTGFLIASGPDVEPSAEMFVEPVALLPDVGATVLSMLGVQGPDELTGVPIKGLAG
jgi:predicted AlkP superfamily phosphohydrolase/phosphomutase